MPKFITFVKFTEKGLEEIRQSKARLEVTKVAMSTMGVRLLDHYMMMGPWDLVMICEAPDDVTAARAQYLSEFKGHVRAETYRIFEPSEYDGIIRSMPAG